MKRYYFIRNGEVTEATEAEYISVDGNNETHKYVADVYHGKMSASEVPEEHREKVMETVENRTAVFGDYHLKELSDSEALSIILGGETT